MACRMPATLQLREGLGGSFTYCTLGEPIDAEGMLTGAALPSYAALAAYLLHTASGSSRTNGRSCLCLGMDDGLFHTSDDNTDYYLLYQPSIDWLRSNEAVLNEEQAERIAAASRQEGRKGPSFSQWQASTSANE